MRGGVTRHNNTSYISPETLRWCVNYARRNECFTFDSTNDTQNLRAFNTIISENPHILKKVISDVVFEGTLLEHSVRALKRILNACPYQTSPQINSSFNVVCNILEHSAREDMLPQTSGGNAVHDVSKELYSLTTGMSAFTNHEKSLVPSLQQRLLGLIDNAYNRTTALAVPQQIMHGNTFLVAAIPTIIVVYLSNTNPAIAPQYWQQFLQPPTTGFSR